MSQKFFDSPNDHISRCPVVPILVYKIRAAVEHIDGSREWICNVLGDRLYNHCICGKCIEINYIAVHKTTNNCVIVGSDCIKKFWMKDHILPDGKTIKAAEVEFSNECICCNNRFITPKMTATTCSNCLIRKRCIHCLRCDRPLKWTGRVQDAPACSCSSCAICGSFGVFEGDKCSPCKKLCNRSAIPHLSRMFLKSIEASASVIDIVDILANTKHFDHRRLTQTLRRWRHSNLTQNSQTFTAFWEALLTICEKLGLTTFA